MCSGCHREADPKYCDAPKKAECKDCHAASLENPLLLAMERTIRFRLSGAEPAELAQARDRLVERLVDGDGFREASDKAEFDLSLAFEIGEVKDPGLIPPSSGIRLFQGSCRLRLAQGGTVLVDRELSSRVESTREPAKARKAILGTLAHVSMHYTREALEKPLED